MRAVVTTLWFLTAFLAGATLYAASRTDLPSRSMGLQDGNLFDRCRQAGACGKPPAPSHGPPLSADMDRA